MEGGRLSFVSEDAYTWHRAYASDLLKKWSILQKSIPYLENKSPVEVLTEKRGRRMPPDVRMLAVETEAHMRYFSSFAAYATVSDAFCRRFGSVTSFFYRIYEDAMQTEAPFLFVGTGRDGGLVTGTDSDMLACGRPVLALDLCEHAYFYDYRFDRKAYIKAMVNCLDVGKLLSEKEEM